MKRASGKKIYHSNLQHLHAYPVINYWLQITRAELTSIRYDTCNTSYSINSSTSSWNTLWRTNYANRFIGKFTKKRKKTMHKIIFCLISLGRNQNNCFPKIFHFWRIAVRESLWIFVMYHERARHQWAVGEMPGWNPVEGQDDRCYIELSCQDVQIPVWLTWSEGTIPPWMSGGWWWAEAAAPSLSRQPETRPQT